MTPGERRNLVHGWYALTEQMDEAWKSWRELGVSIESPFPDVAWRMHEEYTKLIEQVVGVDDHNWLSWFKYDRPKGCAELRFSGATYQVSSLSDLLDVFDAEYPLGQEAEIKVKG